MKILIAYDGSESSDAAVDDLRRAGLPKNVDALVMTSVIIRRGNPKNELVDEAESWAADSIFVGAKGCEE